MVVTYWSATHAQTFSKYPLDLEVTCRSKDAVMQASEKPSLGQVL